MNIELEKKFRITNANRSRLELAELGAELAAQSHDVDVYFKVPQQKPNTRYLRIRSSGNISTLAYHEVINDLETKEWETQVTNGQMAQDIITKLGFKIDVIVDKTRQKYRFKNSVVLLDHIANLGYFIEIESPNEQELDDIASKLTLGKIVIGKGYPDLIKKHNAPCVHTFTNAFL